MLADLGPINAITSRIIKCAIEVHRRLGPGLLENAYHACLCHEMGLEGLAFNRECAFPVIYRGVAVGCVYKLDLLVEEEKWVAGVQSRTPRTRAELAGFIDTSIIEEARKR